MNALFGWFNKKLEPDEAEIDRLIDAFHGSIGARRDQEARKLTENWTDFVVDHLIALIARDDPERRYGALDLLRRMRESRAVELLGSLIEHGERNFRYAVAEALGDIGDPRAVDALILRLEDDNEDDDMRGLAALALEKIGDPRAIEPLARVIADLDPELSDDDILAGPARSALEKLRAQHPNVRAQKPSGMPLVKKLTHSSAEVRRDAAEKLGRRRDAATVDALIATLADPDPAVRGAAADALGAIQDAKALDALIPCSMIGHNRGAHICPA